MSTRLRGMRVWRERGAAVAGLAVLAASVVVVTLVAMAVILTRNETRFGTEHKKPQWRADTVSALKNGATAMEVWGTDNAGAYFGACGGTTATSCPPFRPDAAGPDNHLVENGLEMAPGVVLEVPRADATGYCIVATHDNLPGRVLYISSETGVVSDEPCI